MNLEKQRLNEIQGMNKGTLMELVDIRYISFSGDSIVAEMPVSQKLKQPFGLLHGGMNAVLSETLGSLLSMLQYKKEDKKTAVGVNINVNHLKAVKEGKVIATANFLKKGRNIHFVEIEIKNDKGEITSYATMTNKIIDLD